jgi:protein gp37
MTKIQWTDCTWNPIASFDKDTGKRGWFCAHVSPGCAHCYAESFNRFRGNGHAYTAQNAKRVEIRLMEHILTQPLSWRKPRRVFVCSMTDLFLDEHTDDQIARMFAVMAVARQHTFQVLTKRPARMRAWLADRDRLEDIYAQWPSVSGTPEEVTAWPLPNVWLGVTCEDQRRADERIPVLLDTPAAIRFLSCEPLIGPIDLNLAAWRAVDWKLDQPTWHPRTGARLGFAASLLDWCIIGGESGRDARDFDLAWAHSLVQQCRAAGIRPFVKQLGRHPVAPNDESRYWPNEDMPLAASYEPHHQGESAPLDLIDSHGGNIEEWPSYLRVREFPEAVTV